MAKKTKAEVDATSKDAPVMALKRVTYGEGLEIMPQTMFRPSSDEERDELFHHEAVRDLNEAEMALWNQQHQTTASDPIG